MVIKHFSGMMMDFFMDAIVTAELLSMTCNLSHTNKSTIRAFMPFYEQS